MLNSIITASSYFKFMPPRLLIWLLCMISIVSMLSTCQDIETYRVEGLPPDILAVSAQIDPLSGIRVTVTTPISPNQGSETPLEDLYVSGLRVELTNTEVDSTIAIPATDSPGRYALQDVDGLRANSCYVLQVTDREGRQINSTGVCVPPSPKVENAVIDIIEDTNRGRLTPRIQFELMDDSQSSNYRILFVAEDAPQKVSRVQTLTDIDLEVCDYYDYSSLRGIFFRDICFTNDVADFEIIVTESKDFSVPPLEAVFAQISSIDEGFYRHFENEIRLDDDRGWIVEPRKPSVILRGVSEFL